jgi:hypothetical protein
MLLSHYQDAGQNPGIKIANKSFENVAQVRYLETTVTNQNSIQEEIKRTLNLGVACYHCAHNFLPSYLLHMKIKFRIFIQVYNFACGSVGV